jgi:hypothetical protein
LVPGQAEHAPLRHEDLTPHLLIPTVLVDRERRNDQRIGFSVVYFPTSAAQAKQRWRADMSMRATYRRLGANIRKM